MLTHSLRTHRIYFWVTGCVPLLAMLATSAVADTITVCWDGGGDYVTIQEGIDAAVDGNTSEITPLDLAGEGRFFDDPDTDDTGGGIPPIVGMGAYEFGGTGPQPCPGDLDGDRDVDEADLGILLASWQTSSDGDLSCDGETGQADLGILLSHWGEL